MTIYAYIVVHDNGFAPNPFFGNCTLACCKPLIRRTAQKGDWIVGLTPRAQGNQVVYFMRVDEVMDFGRYWSDERFRQKRPRHDRDVKHSYGDNIYEPLPGGGFRQVPSKHSDNNCEHAANKDHDLGGRNVLVSEAFAYFGSKPVPLPAELEFLIAGRGHRCRFSDDEKLRFLEFVSTHAFGVHASPRKWSQRDNSWIPGVCGKKSTSSRSVRCS